MGEPTPTGVSYIENRVDDQIEYFERSASINQFRYRLFKRVAIACNILTTTAIALVFIVPDGYVASMGILALILSTIVLATYQVEEFESHGAKWEKFRLVAEQLKAEKHMYLHQAGRYASAGNDKRHQDLVETVEGIIRGTDISYFSLMIDPGRRIEKRLESRERQR